MSGRTPALSQAFQTVTGRALERGGRDGHEAYTDASLVAALTGNPNCTVFGPVSTDVAHTADEYVEVEQLETARRVLRELARITLGASLA
jgi:succinyl-diaminopimelate desuccinylase